MIQTVSPGNGGYSTICGGSANTVGSSGAASGCFIGGGLNNTCNGENAAVLGGNGNTANGLASIALGQSATSSGDHSVTIADGNPLVNSTNSSFAFGFSGGGVIYSNAGHTAGVTLAAAASSWGSVSLRSAKKDFLELDYASVLGRVEKIPVYSYKYKGSPRECYGIMADDFHAAFELEAKEKDRLEANDQIGVALACIHGLAARCRALESRLSALAPSAPGPL